jgi:hypothetical protein
MRLALLCFLVAASGCTPAGLVARPLPGASRTSGASAAGGAVALTWASRVYQFSREEGRQLVFTCPSGGRAERVTGTDTYGETSSICTAAVHAGLISLASGGQVTVEVRPGRDAYSGSRRNGITSVSYGRMTNSFVFVR